MGRLVALCLTLPLALFCADARAGEKNSLWATDYGEVTLTVADDGKVTGSYLDYDGRLLGELIGDEVSATWIQPTSEKRCDRPLLGSFYWGTVKWKVADTGLMTGVWSYCSNSLGSDGVWNGRLLTGRLSASIAALDPVVANLPTRPNRPVSDQDVLAMFERYVGPKAEIIKAQQLSGDFTCDGVADRALGYLDTQAPDAPEYVVLMVTTSGDNPDGDVQRFGFGEARENLCPEAAGQPISIAREETTRAEAKGFTGSDVCGLAVRLVSKPGNAGSCSDPRIFWQLSRQPGGRPGDRISIGRN